jgi:phosphoglucomutase
MDNKLDSTKYLTDIANGFATLNVDQKYKDQALSFIRQWLDNEQFFEYRKQIVHLIEKKYWDYILDCFYQVIPFGTGGRRGEVGIGPNRINKWTIQASAQGHSQYLINQYGEDAKSRGVVLAYGVREFFTNKYFNDNLSNPVKNLTGKSLAYSAAEVYAANGVKVMIFDAPRTTPELSFAVRHLNAVAGDMFDASHNPPEHNGKKVYDEFGGQLIPPFDEKLVTEVTENVHKINVVSIDEAKKNNLFHIIPQTVDVDYTSILKKLSLSGFRNIKIAYTPLHGVGMTTVFRVLKECGFDVTADPNTSYQSGKFENVTFNIPNPEVRESFDTTLKYAKEIGADIILNSDPDADRIGVMVRNNNDWVFLNGNEIGAILTRYVIEKRAKSLVKPGVVVKTTVTTNLATKICEANNIKVIGELPVGFKYIGDDMNVLEKADSKEEFIFGLEESHGYISGAYSHDKDASVGAIWLAELSAELKTKGETLLDYLDDTYSRYGYFRNYLTEIRLPGAEGMEQIRKIQDTLRIEKPTGFGKFKVQSIEDFLNRKPIVSETDKAAKDLLVFHLQPFGNYTNLKVTLRPSGTEPKAKMYFELGNEPVLSEQLEAVKTSTEADLKELEKVFLKHCYKVLGVDFPDRGFLIFWQVPMKDKLHYFEIEKDIENLKVVTDSKERETALRLLVEFLGSDGIEKVDGAFIAKNGVGIRDYLNLKAPL